MALIAAHLSDRFIISLSHLPLSHLSPIPNKACGLCGRLFPSFLTAVSRRTSVPFQKLPVICGHCPVVTDFAPGS